MKLLIAAVGREKSNSPTNQLFVNLQKRIPWEVTVKEIEEKRKLPPEQLKTREAELLLQAIPAGAKIIALDEHGKNMDSPSFAAKITDWQDMGHQSIAFVIGGAYGHGEALRQKADLLLSFGKMTWPHMLVRPMLIEQIYRAYTISTGHPYHKA